jgi:hypothetical protein
VVSSRTDDSGVETLKLAYLSCFSVMVHLMDMRKQSIARLELAKAVLALELRAVAVGFGGLRLGGLGGML